MTVKNLCLALLGILAIFARSTFRIARAEMKYEGVKFYVHKTQKPGTVRFHRLLLINGTHCYTTSEAEVERLVKDVKARVEPMDAFVFRERVPGTVRLYRFTLNPKKSVTINFYTAFEPEMKDIARREDSRLQDVRAYVYPHDFRPMAEQATEIIPMYWFYNPESQEHFYTTSEIEKNGLVAQTKDVEARRMAEEQKRNERVAREEQSRRENVLARFQKLRGKPPVAVGLVGNVVRVGEIDWTITRALRVGRTLKSNKQFVTDLTAGGEYLRVELQVENKGKTPRTLVAPTPVDAEARMFINSIEAELHIPGSRRLSLLKTLNPSVPFTCEIIFDVPTEIKSPYLLIGDLDLLADAEGAIDLGL